MRSFSIRQLVLLGLGVVTVVFGVAYARMYIGTPPPPTGADKVKAAQLTFSSVLWPDEATDQSGPPYELHVAAHHAFWYRNDTDKPVEVSLISKTCKCTKVEICTLPPDLQGAAAEALDRQAESPSLAWKKLEAEEGRPFTVPAHAAGGVRLNWKGESLGPKGLAADLHTDSAGVAGDPIHLEARVNFVLGMRVSAEDHMKDAPLNTDVSVGTLEERGTRSLELLCWSATRDHFDVQVEAEPPADPCVTAGKPAPLSKAECAALGPQIRCAYRVPVTVRERTPDGHQFDLGHFRRYFRFTSPQPGIEPFSFGITGVVRGDIVVKGHDDRNHVIPDQVPLSSFEREEGAQADVTLTTDRNGLDLEVESHPDFVKVQLKEEKGAELIGKAWTLHVEVPPNTWVGPIPHGSDIVLKTKGDHPRRIRIPVTGNAYVK